MANIKSAKKKIHVIERQTLANKMRKSEIKTYLRKFDKAIADEDFDSAKELLRVINKKLYKAANKNIIHKNKAARKMSRLQRVLREAV